MELAESYSPVASESAETPLLSEQERAGTQTLRRSLGIVTIGWVFGSVWANSTTGAPLTLFARTLGATPFQFGVLSALPFIASLISLPGSVFIERTGKRKSIFLDSFYIQRLMWVVIALAPVLMIGRFGWLTAPRAMGLVLMLMFFMHATGAFGAPAWVSWMADVVPGRLRGRYFARRRQWGIVSAIPAALIVGWVLDRGAGGDRLTILKYCAGIFLAATIFGFLDIHSFRYVPETRRPVCRGTDLFHALAPPLRSGRFLAFSGFVGMLTFAYGFMSQFSTLYLVEKVHVTNASIQMMLLVAPMLAQLVILPVWGRVSDRMGKKPLVVVAALGLAPMGLGWCFVTEGHPWLGYLMSAGGAALWTAVEIGNFNFVLDASGADPKKSGSGFVAVNSVIVNLAGCMGGLAAGLICQSLKNWSWQPIAGMKAFSGYDVLFASSGILRLAAVVIFLPFLYETAARGISETVQFMCATLIQNLKNGLGRFRPGSGSDADSETGEVVALKQATMAEQI